MKQKSNNQSTKIKRTIMWTLSILLVILLFYTLITTNFFVHNLQTASLNQTKGKMMEKNTGIPAIELVSPDYYHNTNDTNITIGSLIGKKVILVDFWTYSCINCQRTLPYLNSWYDKYKDDGLEIIGVHTPEFEFEHDPKNVANAITKFGIKFPVVQDNEYKTWQAYDNHYWPHKYLIDIYGNIVYDHIGEGNYEETESKIQELLEERAQVISDENSNETMQQNISAISLTQENQTPMDIRTPEIYAGFQFSRNQFGNENGYTPYTAVNYTIPQNVLPNFFYLNGTWQNNPDNMQIVNSTGQIELTFFATKVHIVAASANKTPVTVTVNIDGTDVGSQNILDATLYTLYDGKTPQAHKLILNAQTGLQFYTFTFS